MKPFDGRIPNILQAGGGYELSPGLYDPAVWGEETPLAAGPRATQQARLGILALHCIIIPNWGGVADFLADAGSIAGTCHQQQTPV